jgi:hypothetical protein
MSSYPINTTRYLTPCHVTQSIFGAYVSQQHYAPFIIFKICGGKLLFATVFKYSCWYDLCVSPSTSWNDNKWYSYSGNWSIIMSLKICMSRFFGVSTTLSTIYDASQTWFSNWGNLCYIILCIELSSSHGFSVSLGTLTIFLDLVGSLSSPISIRNSEKAWSFIDSIFWHKWKSFVLAHK